ncbi:Glutamyl-tRNA Synthetase, chloroplast precursor [Tribonema minus]|uniref:glutamate--tRNA ligase n=1 Tax=Tribonema minus TaxID=303371 RepID=A0A836CIJ4_9STRA|nr:Glutamyl-tRNA Synthetase, chloroplast precursor [Tribonema minus]
MSALAEDTAVDTAPVLSAQGSAVRVRFAPSPTGTLHVGGARTALFNYLKARNEGGKFVLRIEDTDEARSTRESEDSMVKDLKWLGLDWDEGPDKPGDCGPYRQSERKHIYADVAKQLVDSGFAYPCFCSEEELEAKRAEAEAAGRPPQYDGTWRDADPAAVQAKLDAGEPHTYRFKVPPGKVVAIKDLVRGDVSWDADSTVGDFILLRSSGVPVYNFCVAVDDALMGITHVIRAEEHLTNTLRQCLILDALGRARPQYAHCSLILGEDRSKLSKRHGATSVDQFRQQGFLPEAMKNYLSLLGWNDGSEKEIFTEDELKQSFDLRRVIKSPAVFDMQKLRWMNGQHLRALPDEELSPLVGTALVEAGICTDAQGEFVAACTHICKGSMELVADAVPQVQMMLSYPLVDTLVSEEAHEIMEDGFVDIAKAVLAAHEAGELTPASEADAAAQWKAWIKALGKTLGRKGKRLFHPVRVAITGAMSGADVGEQLACLRAAGGEGVEHVSLDARMAQLREWVDKQ